MNYQIIWSPGRIYDIVDHQQRTVASLVMEGSLWSPARSATMTAGARRWAVNVEGIFSRRFVLTDEKGQVTSAQNEAVYSCDLALSIDRHMYRFQNRSWMINYLTISEDGRDIIDVHNKWLRFSSEAGDVSFRAGEPSEIHLLLAIFGFYQLRVLEYSSSN